VLDRGRLGLPTTPNRIRESLVLGIDDFVVGQTVIAPSRAALPPPSAVRSAPP
jgi:hypothetical protein